MPRAKYFPATSALALSFMFAIAAADAQTAPAAPTNAPAPVAPKPTVFVPRFPAGIDPAAEANAEERFAVEQETATANAIATLCATHFGSEQRCGGRARPDLSGEKKQDDAGKAAAAAATAIAATPVFVESNLWGTARQGILFYPDGHEEVAIVGKAATGDYVVTAITRDSITLKKGSHATTLSLQTRSASSLPATVAPIMPSQQAPQLPPAAFIPAPQAVAPTAAPTAGGKKDKPGMFSIDSPIPPEVKPAAPGASTELPQ